MNDNETLLKELLEESLKREFSEFNDLEKIPDHKFSLKHRLAMKKIFARYEKNIRKFAKPQAAEAFVENNYIPHYRLKQRIIIALVIVFLMTLMTGCFIPLRSVTQAQIDWLRSKYDFPNMLMWISDLDDGVVNNSSQVQVVGSYYQPEDCRNFLADLVELGLYTEKEMRDIVMKSDPRDTRPVPKYAEDSFAQILVSDMEVSPLESYRKYVLKVENKIKFYKDRAKDPENAWEGDEEFAEVIEEFLPLPKSFLDLLEKLYAEIPDDVKEYRNFLSELDKDNRIYLAEIHKI